MFRLLLFALVFAACISPAVAGIAGRWASTSGSSIVIPASKEDFVLVVTHADGKVYKLNARWVKGQVGSQFTFINEYGRKVTATVDPENVDRVRLTVEDRVYYWKRV